MYKHFISGILFCTLLFFTNCNNEKTPKDILSKEKMVLLLADMHIVEAAVNTRSYMLGSGEYAYYVGDAYKQVYKNHKTTKKIFDKSFAYYSQHPEILNGIYQEVISELSKKQAEAVNTK